MDDPTMKQKTMAIIGVAITLILMLALAYSIYVYADNPDDDGAMMAMSALSSGMMVFLIVFAVIYTRPKPADEYMEMYQGICSRCGTPFGPDGVCPKCGRHRPQPRNRSARPASCNFFPGILSDQLYVPGHRNDVMFNLRHYVL